MYESIVMSGCPAFKEVYGMLADARNMYQLPGVCIVDGRDDSQLAKYLSEVSGTYDRIAVISDRESIESIGPAVHISSRDSRSFTERFAEFLEGRVDN